MWWRYLPSIIKSPVSSSSDIFTDLEQPSFRKGFMFHSNIDSNFCLVLFFCVCVRRSTVLGLRSLHPRSPIPTHSLLCFHSTKGRDLRDLVTLGVQIDNSVCEDQRIGSRQRVKRRKWTYLYTKPSP